MSFVQRDITINFSLGGQGGTVPLSNISFPGMRTSVHIKIAGQHANTATAAIYGLSLAHMNALSKVPFKPTKLGANTIQIQAGDKENGMSTVFEGTIIQAWPDMQSAPEVFLRVDAKTGAYESVKPVTTTSFAGPTKAAVCAQVICGKMNLPLENNNVQYVLDSPYFWGTGIHQMMQLAKATRMGWVVEKGTVAIWPQGGVRTQAGQAYISKETGMVGYPFAVPGGIVVKTLFNKAVAFASTMQIKSDITIANGTWGISMVELELESQMPRGRWFCTLYGYPISS